MAAQPKLQPGPGDQPVRRREMKAPTAPATLSSAGAEFGVVPASPALLLQETLRAELAEDEPKYSARRVTATVIVVCSAFWLSLYLLVSSLV